MNKIPGAAWVALIGLISAWISTYFGNWEYGATVVIVLGAIANIVKVTTTKPADPILPSAEGTPRGFSSVTYEPPSQLSRFLFGG